MKKALKFVLKLLGKLALAGLIAFVVTFAIYMTNAENKIKRRLILTAFVCNLLIFSALHFER